MPYLQSRADGSLLLALTVQPRASKNEIPGLHGDTLKLRLTTPPVDGRANKAVISFLAGRLHLPKSALSIQSGQQSRKKKVLIRECSEQKVRELLGVDHTAAGENRQQE